MYEDQYYLTLQDIVHFFKFNIFMHENGISLLVFLFRW